MTEVTFTDQNIGRIRSIHHGNFLHYLSSAYEVLKKIFSYLSLEDLESVSEAFERWRPVVETTKKERAKIETFVLSQKCQTCEVWSEAAFCMTFCMSRNKPLDQKLWKHLTKDPQILIIESRFGVIGTPNNFSQIIQQRMLRCGSPAPTAALATHLRIPEFTDVGVKVFIWNKNISFKDFRNSFSLPDNNIVKCLLILTTSQETSREACEQKDDFVFFLETYQSEPFAVGGCFIDWFLNDSDKKREDVITKYIVFYGSNVEAASIVLNEEVKTKESVDSKIEELKSICPKTDCGVLFVFKCVNRNKILEQRKIKNQLCKWEGDSMSKFFPFTPVIGCYGYGEFGRKFPEEEEPSPVKKRVRRSDIWEHSFSTSIVYVGFKK